MPEEVKTKAITWVKLIVGVLLFAAMLYIHAAIKEINLLLYAVPGWLMGIDPEKIIRLIKK